jgi:hypothetical protein
VLEVADYSGTPCALQLQHTRQSLNLGTIKSRIFLDLTTKFCTSWSFHMQGI